MSEVCSLAYTAVASRTRRPGALFNSQRSGSQSSSCSAVGFTPDANNAGSASRKYANGSIKRCLQVPTTEYSTAAVFPPTSLPITPQLFRLCGSPHNRNNWLHLGGDGGLKPMAVLLSVTASVKRHGTDPWVYLKHILTELPARPVGASLTDLLPDAGSWSRADSSYTPAK